MATWLASGGKLQNWRIKPPALALDWRNPLTRGLVFDSAYQTLGGHTIDNASGAVGAVNSAASLAVGPWGACLLGSGDRALSDNTYSATSRTSNLARAQFSIEVLFSQSSSANEINLIGTSAWTFLLNDLTLPQGGLSFAVQASGTSGLWTAITEASILDIWSHAVLTYSRSGAPVVYFNGVPVAWSSITLPSGTPVDDSSSPIQISGGDYGFSLSGAMSHARLWNRVLGASEVTRLYSDPYQIYQMPRTRSFLANAALPQLPKTFGTIVV